MNPPRDVAAAPAIIGGLLHDVAATLDRLLVAGETYTAWFSAEASDFVRINRGQVRQPGAVVQRYLGVD